MRNVNAVPSLIVLAVLLGSSSGVRAEENFVLLVNMATGHVAIRSDFPFTVWIDQYSISSAAGSLSPATWNSLEDQNNWQQTSSTSTLLFESNAGSETSFQTGTGFSLGQAFNVVLPAPDLVFHFRLAGSTTPSLGVVQYGSFTAPPNPVHEVMPCLGDFVSSRTFQPPPDGQVDGADLAFLLGEWGATSGGGGEGSSPADLVSSATFEPPPDGFVDGADLAVMLGAWGACN